MGTSALTVVETSAFARRAEKLLTPDEYEALILFLATHPEAGDEIQGTGGVRKVRFSAQGRGKSGGVRAIYYFYDCEMPLYAIFLYGKNEQVTLSAKQKQEVAALAAILKKQGPVEEEAMKKTNRAEDLVEAMREAAAIASGELPPAKVRSNLPLDIDVRSVRTATGLSRAEFARKFGLDLRAIQDWEQGRRYPDRAARAYLTVIARRPDAVLEALGS